MTYACRGGTCARETGRCKRPAQPARWRKGLSCATCNPLAKGSATDGLAVELDGARDTLCLSLGIDAVGKHVEERRLASAARTDDRTGLAAAK